MSGPSILIFSPTDKGGIAEHTFYQARALRKLGASVICLVSSSFLGNRIIDFALLRCLPAPVQGESGFYRKLRTAWRVITCRLILAFQIAKIRPDLVLLDSYVEYLSPFWIWPHWILSVLFGFRYAANLHDPVRNYVVGPNWWHRLSVRMAYLPLNFVLVHDRLPQSGLVPKKVSVIQVPVGIYEIDCTQIDARRIREQWGAKAGQKVFLSFGFVRDGKNIDLVIQALKRLPEAFLVVAGSVASASDKPFSYYRDLACKLGVMEQCHFWEGFVPDDAQGRYFAGADFVLLNYSRTFHSQSGVLSIAVACRKPVLASAGSSPLLESVRNYGLGEVIRPDEPEEVVLGMKKLLLEQYHSRWDEYRQAASWEANAIEIMKMVKCVASM